MVSPPSTRPSVTLQRMKSLCSGQHGPHTTCLLPVSENASAALPKPFRCALNSPAVVLSLEATRLVLSQAFVPAVLPPWNTLPRSLPWPGLDWLLLVICALPKTTPASLATAASLCPCTIHLIFLRSRSAVQNEALFPVHPGFSLCPSTYLLCDFGSVA